MNRILRRSVGLFMVGFAIFTAIGQFQNELSAEPEFGSFPWLAVLLFSWLAFLNLRPQKRLKRGQAPGEDQ